MLNENSIKLLEEKIKDEEFVNRLVELESDKEVVEMLNSEGISISIEEVNQIRNHIVKNLSDNNGELNDLDLEEVAGGLVGTAIAIFGVIAAIFGAGSFVSKVTNRRW